jgi:hypothetical protein
MPSSFVVAKYREMDITFQRDSRGFVGWCTGVMSRG